MATAITVLAMAIVWFSYMAWAIERNAPAPETLIIMVLILATANGLFFAYARTLRCPNCGVRFGPKMYSTGFVHHPWPRKECWNCGANMPEIEERQGPFHAQQPIIAPALGKRGFPVTWRAMLLFVAIWNGLALTDSSILNGVLTGNQPPTPATPSFPGWSFVLALLFAFGFSWGTKSSSGMQTFVLKEGHSVEEIKPFLSLMQVISGVMLLVFAAVLIARILR
jgi:hypothetical protein